MMLDADRVRHHIQRLFEIAGAQSEVSSAVARVLVEGDLLGYHTHGVMLARQYLSDLKEGRAAGGTFHVPRLQRESPVASLDCGHTFGPYVVEQALAATSEVARAGGVGVLALGRSHHIGCLAAYLAPMEHQDLITVIMSSNPARASVLPHGGREAVITPNPVAVRIPTENDPIILDISTSTVTNGTVARARSLGEKLRYNVLLDADGAPTNDPTLAQEGGGILPLGGLEFGYKGFGLGLLVEALTSGLAGSGRRQRPTGLGASVFVMSLSSSSFAGVRDLVEEMQFLAQSCMASTPRHGSHAVRLPGSEALRRRRERTRDGFVLPADALEALAEANTSLGLELDVNGLQAVAA